VLHEPRWGLLRTPPGPDGGSSCHCVTDHDDPDRVPCATEVRGDTVLQRLLSAGGGILGRAEMLAMAAELDAAVGEADGRPGPG